MTTVSLNPSPIHSLSQRAHQIKESQIRESSRYCEKFGAINLAQGLPDFPAPEALKEAARAAVVVWWGSVLNGAGAVTVAVCGSTWEQAGQRERGGVVGALWEHACLLDGHFTFREYHKPCAGWTAGDTAALAAV